MLDQIAKTSNTLSFLLLLLFVAWGPIAQGSVFAGGQAIITILGALVFLFCILGVALSKRPRFYNLPWITSIVLMIIWIVLSILHAQYSFAAFQQGGLLVSMFLAALSAQYLLRTVSRRNIFGLWLLLVGTTMSAYGIIQKMGYGKTLTVDPALITSFYYNPSHFAGYIILALPISLWALLFHKSILTKVLGLATSVALFYCLLHTSSSSFPAAVLASSIVFTLWIWRLFRPLGFIFATSIVLLVGGSVWLISDQQKWPLIDQALKFSQKTSMSGFVLPRKRILEQDLKATQHTPLYGVGPGNFVYFMPKFRPDKADKGNDPSFKLVNYAHNDYFQVAIELGKTGLAIYLIIITLTLLSGRRQDMLGASLLSGLTGLWISGLYDAHSTVIAGTMAWAWVSTGAIAGFSIPSQDHAAITAPVESK